MLTNNQLKFSRLDSGKFFRTLNKRVNAYFKENEIQRTGNWKLHLKTVIMFSIYLTPYFLLLTLDLPTWGQVLMTIIMGVGMAGIGMNVMHDANHGAYSSKKWINKVLGSSIYILAGNVYNWQVQHNVLHHTYTNIHGHDEDSRGWYEFLDSPNTLSGINCINFSTIIVFYYTACSLLIGQ